MVIYLGKCRIFTANWTNVILSAHAWERKKAGRTPVRTVLRSRRIRSNIVRGLGPQTISQILQQCYEEGNSLKLLLYLWILILHQGHFKSPHLTIPELAVLIQIPKCLMILSKKIYHWNTKTAEYEAQIREGSCNSKNLFWASNLWVISSSIYVAISKHSLFQFSKRFPSSINKEELETVKEL